MPNERQMRVENERDVTSHELMSQGGSASPRTMLK